VTFDKFWKWKNIKNIYRALTLISEKMIRSILSGPASAPRQLCDSSGTPRQYRSRTEISRPGSSRSNSDASAALPLALGQGTSTRRRRGIRDGVEAREQWPLGEAERVPRLACGCAGPRSSWSASASCSLILFKSDEIQLT
jgi:hypothetical protein